MRIKCWLLTFFSLPSTGLVCMIAHFFHYDVHVDDDERNVFLISFSFSIFFFDTNKIEIFEYISVFIRCYLMYVSICSHMIGVCWTKFIWKIVRSWMSLSIRWMSQCLIKNSPFEILEICLHFVYYFLLYPNIPCCRYRLVHHPIFIIDCVC